MGWELWLIGMKFAMVLDGIGWDFEYGMGWGFKIHGMGRDLMMFFKFRMGWYGMKFLVWIGYVWDHPEWKTIYFEWDRMGWSYSTSSLVCNIGMSSYHRIRRTLVDAAYFLNLSRGRIHYWSWYNRGDPSAPLLFVIREKFWLVICYSGKKTMNAICYKYKRERFLSNNK